jgi:hypothetical protein
MSKKSLTSSSKIPFAGVGLIFGSALGFALGDLIFDQQIWIAGAGAAIGLLIGAAIDAFKRQTV